MSKKTKTEKSGQDAQPVELLPEPRPLVKAPVVRVQRPRGKTYSFEQWAKIRNRPERHLGGMRAFLGAKASSKFSLEAWDQIFLAY